MLVVVSSACVEDVEAREADTEPATEESSTTDSDCGSESDFVNATLVATDDPEDIEVTLSQGYAFSDSESGRTIVALSNYPLEPCSNVRAEGFDSSPVVPGPSVVVTFVFGTDGDVDVPWGAVLPTDSPNVLLGQSGFILDMEIDPECPGALAAFSLAEPPGPESVFSATFSGSSSYSGGSSVRVDGEFSLTYCGEGTFE